MPAARPAWPVALAGRMHHIRGPLPGLGRALMITYQAPPLDGSSLRRTMGRFATGIDDVAGVNLLLRSGGCSRGCVLVRCPHLHRCLEDDDEHVGGELGVPRGVVHLVGEEQPVGERHQQLRQQ
jgi:hypothetical protein